MQSIIQYLKARLEETSTKLAIMAGITSAAALDKPWNYIFVGVAVVFAIIPTEGDQNAGTH